MHARKEIGAYCERDLTRIVFRQLELPPRTQIGLLINKIGVCGTYIANTLLLNYTIVLLVLYYEAIGSVEDEVRSTYHEESLAGNYEVRREK